MKNTLELFSPELLIWQLTLLLAIVLPSIALINILRNDFKENNKLLWVLAVIFTNLIGVFLYYKFGRLQKIKNSKLHTKMN